MDFIFKDEFDSFANESQALRLRFIGDYFTISSSQEFKQKARGFFLWKVVLLISLVSRILGS